jgi:hypothetical protein
MDYAAAPGAVAIKSAHNEFKPFAAFASSIPADRRL